MALTTAQKVIISEITQKSYAKIDEKASSLNAEQESWIADDIDLWEANRNKLKIKLKGDVNYETMPLLNEIRLRTLNTFGFSVGMIAGVFAGGISKSAKEAREADLDRINPGFTADLHL